MRLRTIAACDAYRAWRVTSGETYPLDIGNPETLHDALNEVKLGNALQHKDGLFIHAFDSRKNAGTLHTYTVVKKAATYRTSPITGRPERFEPLDFKPLHTLAIDHFEPTPPFDAMRDDPTGVDRTLVSVREA